MMKPITYLTKRLILKIHDNLPPDISGFMSETNLDYLIETAKYFPEDRYVEVNSFEEKISWVSSYYLFNLVSSHPFSDGNKRTAFLSLSTFLIANDCISNYDEKKVSDWLDKINSLVSSGKLRPKEAIKKFESEMKDTPEYLLINLLFDLAASEGITVYTSPTEIYPNVSKFIFSIDKARGLFQIKAWFTNFIREMVSGKDK